MRAIRCNEWKPFRELAVEEIPAPPLGAGRVRIGVQYAGVSFATDLVTRGHYQRKPPRPFTPGTEVAGEILEAAPGVTRFKPGDRVCAVVDWGAHAEEVVTDPATVYRLPDSFPFDIAPQMPASYATSHAALSRRAGLREGETLLVHGAAGAVGLAAVELGKAMGALVIATASTLAKLDVARRHGADHGVLFPSGSALEEIRGLAPAGVNVVFDPIGGDGFDLALRCTGNEGRILVIGFAAGRIQQIPANILLVKNIAVLGFNYGLYVGWGLRDERHVHEPKMRGSMEAMFALYEAGRLHPTTSHIFPLDGFRDAMTAVLERRGIGKVLLRMPRAG